MTKRRAVLLMVLALLVGAYGERLYQRLTNPWFKVVLQIHGQSRIAKEAKPNGEPDMSEPLSPTTIAAMCKLRKFKIEFATENVEFAKIPMGDLTSDELKCVIEHSQQQILGDPPRSPMMPQQPPHYYVPNDISVESSGPNAQTH